MIEDRRQAMAILVTADLVTARSRTVEALAGQGFGVLTEIDVSATLKKKLDVDFRPYVILGACNPPLAHRALQADANIGVLLPCNVIVYANGDGSCTVAAIDPEVQFAKTGSPELQTVATEVRNRLRTALESVEQGLGTPAVKS